MQYKYAAVGVMQYKPHVVQYNQMCDEIHKDRWRAPC